MKLLETVQKAVAAVADAAVPPRRPRSRDPWYYDDERKAEVNAASRRGARRWIARRPAWLK